VSDDKSGRSGPYRGGHGWSGRRVFMRALRGFMMFCGVLAAVRVSAQVPGIGVPIGDVDGSYMSTIDGTGTVQVDFDKSTGTVVAITPTVGSLKLFEAPATANDLVAKTASYIDTDPSLFGVNSWNLDLRGLSIWNKKAWVVNGTQYFSGLRVLDGRFKLVTALDGTLLFLEARLFPETKLEAINLNPILNEEDALQIILNAEPGSVPVFDGSIPVIAFRKDQPVVAWMIEMTNIQNQPRLYVVAGDDGGILSKAEVFDAVDVQGDVQGRGTDPNSLLPDAAWNPPTAQPFPLPELFVDITAGAVGSDETDDNGNFLIPGIQNVNITVRGRALSTPFTIFNVQGAEIEDTETGPATTFFTLRLNPVPAEFTTSQINAFVWAEKARDFADILYYYWGLNVPVRGSNLEVNDNGLVCNGSHTRATTAARSRLRYAPANLQQGCVNAAYSTVVVHEFGHHFTREVQIAIQDRNWGTPMAKKEGSADVFTTFLTDQSIIAQDFWGQGTIIRNLDPNIVFPNGVLPHGVGLALGGSFWDLRTSLEAAYGYIGELVSENFYTDYVETEFMDVDPLKELTEKAGEIVLQSDQVRYGGFYKQFIINAFLPHNLYRHPFKRGDCNGDLEVNFGDMMKILDVISGAVPGCYDACDANGDNQNITLADFTYLSAWLFQGSGQPPPDPGPWNCGRDPESQLDGNPQVWDFQTCTQGPCPN
jgi:hypothetical protein